MSVTPEAPATTRGGEPRTPGSRPAGPRARVAALGRRWNQAEPIPGTPRAAWPAGLRRARTIGFCVFAVQLVALGWWSTVLVHRGALTVDYSAYEQAAYLIAHGHLNPYSSVLLEQFWRNNAEFILWPLALFVRIWPHMTTLPWLQDIALVASEVVALNWMCEIVAARAENHRTPAVPIALIALGIVLLAGNPWVAWTASFDVHMEPFATLFTLCAARDLYRGQRRMWIWVALTLGCGTAGASYAGALGLSAILCGRRWWRSGATLAAVGFGWIVFLQAIHGAAATGSLEYSELALKNIHDHIPKHLATSKIAEQAISHPTRILRALWQTKLNMWANLSPGGVLGILWPPLIVPTVLVAVEAALGSLLFSRPGFQTVALAPFIALGTVALLAAFRPRRRLTQRWLLPAAIALLMLNALAWSIVWLPHVSKSWLLVSPKASTVLQGLSHKIGPDDEVLASQGVLGGFADRADVYLLHPTSMVAPVRTKHVWIVVAPKQGIEPSRVFGFYDDIYKFEHNPRMRLVTNASGIVAFEWTPTSGTHSLKIHADKVSAVPAWALRGTAAKIVTNGPAVRWYSAGTAKPGYVIDEAYWRERPGSFRVSVSLSASESASLQLWDADTGKLLAEKAVGRTPGRQTVSFDATLRGAPAPHEVAGFGPWSASPVEPDGNSLEVRVWSPGGRDRVDVYVASLRKLEAGS